MYDKYKYFEIFEIENGYLLKTEKPADPHNTTNVTNITTYYLGKKALLKALGEELKDGSRSG